MNLTITNPIEATTKSQTMPLLNQLKNCKGQSLLEFILVSSCGLVVATAFAGLLISKVWITNVSDLLLQEYIFCNQKTKTTHCYQDYLRKIENHIPGSKVLKLKYAYRGSVNYASLSIELPFKGQYQINKSIKPD
jgi:hypothetical protein